MQHSAEWNTWLARCYARIRKDILEEAPPAATLLVSLPLKKRTGKELTLGEFHRARIQGADGGFGTENLIVIHPIVLDRPVDALVALVHQMVHASLDEEAGDGHGKEFQAMAQRIGLEKPWGVPQADEALWKYLTGVVAEEGPPSPGVYVPPPPPPARAPTTVKLRCACLPPRELSLSPKKLERGSVVCGECRASFRTNEEQAMTMDGADA